MNRRNRRVKMKIQIFILCLINAAVIAEKAVKEKVAISKSYEVTETPEPKLDNVNVSAGVGFGANGNTGGSGSTSTTGGATENDCSIFEELKCSESTGNSGTTSLPFGNGYASASLGIGVSGNAGANIRTTISSGGSASGGVTTSFGTNTGTTPKPGNGNVSIGGGIGSNGNIGGTGSTSTTGGATENDCSIFEELKCSESTGNSGTTSSPFGNGYASASIGIGVSGNAGANIKTTISSGGSASGGVTTSFGTNTGTTPKPGNGNVSPGIGIGANGNIGGTGSTSTIGGATENDCSIFDDPKCLGSTGNANSGTTSSPFGNGYVSASIGIGVSGNAGANIKTTISSGGSASGGVTTSFGTNTGTTPKPGNGNVSPGIGIGTNGNIGGTGSTSTIGGATENDCSIFDDPKCLGSTENANSGTTSSPFGNGYVSASIGIGASGDVGANIKTTISSGGSVNGGVTTSFGTNTGTTPKPGNGYVTIGGGIGANGNIGGSGSGSVSTSSGTNTGTTPKPGNGYVTIGGGIGANGNIGGSGSGGVSTSSGTNTGTFPKPGNGYVTIGGGIGANGNSGGSGSGGVTTSSGTNTGTFPKPGNGYVTIGGGIGANGNIGGSGSGGVTTSGNTGSSGSNNGGGGTSSQSGSSSTGFFDPSRRQNTYVELGAYMYYSGRIFLSSKAHSRHIYVRNHTDSFTTIQPNKKCPYIKKEAFIQEAINSVKTVGNGLLYDSSTKKLLLLDQFAGKILSYNVETGNVVKLTLIGLDLNGIIPTTVPNEYVVILDNAIVLLENSFTKEQLVMKYKKVLAVFDSVWSLSYAKIDSFGRLWIAAMYKNHYLDNHVTTHIYIIEYGEAIKKIQNNQLVGGMAWSKDTHHLYTTDLLSGTIVDYELEKCVNKTIFNINQHPMMKGIPYDITVDNKGNIWTTLLGGTSVLKINSKTGSIIEIIATPTHYPTSLAFGGVSNSSLYVSSAYAEYPTKDFAKTYIISNTNVTGSNYCVPLDTTKIFGKTTLKLKDPNGYYSRDDSPNADYAIKFSLPPHNLAFTKLENKKCGYLNDNITIQQVPINVETIGMTLHYDVKDKALFLTDMYKPAVIKYNPSNGKNVTLILQDITSVSSIIPIKDEDDLYVASEDHNLVVLKNKFGSSSNKTNPSKEILAKIEPNDMSIVFSNGKVDIKGRLWIGTKYATKSYTHEEKCNLYVLEKKKLTVMETNITSSGGMTWSSDGKQYYFVDSGKGVIYKYMFAAGKGQITNRTTFFNMKYHPDLKGKISDVISDSEDFIWAALDGGSAVLKINSTNGIIAKIVPIPMKYPTSLTFAGSANGMMLYVTSGKGTKNTFDELPYTIAIGNLGTKPGKKPVYRFDL